MGLEVKFKKMHPDAVIPKAATDGSAGLDLVAVSREEVEVGGEIQYRYDTGIAVQIPTNHVGLIFPRSSIRNKNMLLTNSVGVIDSDYTGSIGFAFWGGDEENLIYAVGERLGQLVIVPYVKVEPVEVDKLPKTARGTGGFGSTGK